MNKALLAKLGWRLLTNRNEIWSLMLAKKYNVSEEDVIKFTKKQRSLAVWKGLTWGAELRQLGLRWSVTNGRQIRFWKDCWLRDTPLSQACSQQLDSQKHDALVCDSWIMDRGWDWFCLGNKLPTFRVRESSASNI